MEANGYGMVNIKSPNSVDELPNFADFQKELADNPSPSGDGGYNSQGSSSQCPSVDPNWSVGNDSLPAIPDGAKAVSCSHPDWGLHFQLANFEIVHDQWRRKGRRSFWPRFSRCWRKWNLHWHGRSWLRVRHSCCHRRQLHLQERCHCCTAYRSVSDDNWYHSSVVHRSGRVTVVG
jgi:hypothetical protein